MRWNAIRFDTSDYSADNVYGMPLANKKVLWSRKTTVWNVIMTEFVGLRAKMYAMRVDGKKDIKKAKNVKSNNANDNIRWYVRCLNEEIEMIRRQSCIPMFANVCTFRADSGERSPSPLETEPSSVHEMLWIRSIPISEIYWAKYLPSNYFWNMMWSAAQPSIGTSGSRKEQCLENTVGGVPIWIFLSRFWPASQHVVEHYHAGE